MRLAQARHGSCHTWTSKIDSLQIRNGYKVWFAGVLCATMRENEAAPCHSM